MRIDSTRPRVQAVLGPTNTGKTHYAMERLLGHDSGMIGFPLRLLARENYERAVARCGWRHVALITGEEKILPPHARYFLCTVESMPLERRVSFLAVDEIQMAADPDRGHVFTERLLHARGHAETLFMGAETIRPLIRRLVSDAEFVTRPRFSTLQWAGQKKLTRLPRRSAVVSFSAADVYAIAELVRRQRGGAAVVMGALSPRARNAQVALYQAGEVDWLVATDAIGMGLNMDVDHVAFAATRKFDGRSLRDLTPAELGQIAGRAGRHMNDGTFGTTADAGLLESETVDRIESHAFEDLRFLYWRNHALDYRSLAALQASLAAPPPGPGLVRVRKTDDETALDILARDPQVARLADTPERVRLLWEVARIPDFGKVMGEAHARLLARVFGHLAGEGRLPADWVARHVARLDRADGDIGILSQRIADIRTWTYMAFRGRWLDDPAHWRERTRDVEDRLSDALHERLTQRFVDKRTSVLLRRLKDRARLTATVAHSGEVMVEGHFVGHLEGFRFLPDSAAGPAARAVSGAARAALAGEIATRVRALEADGDDAFAITPDGQVSWRDEPIGRVIAGPEFLRPAAELLDSGLLEGEPRERVRRRLVAAVVAWTRTRLAVLFRAREAELTGAARGLVFRLAEGLGAAPRRAVADSVALLGKEDRRRLRALGLRIGGESVFFPALLRPAAIEARRLLWGLRTGVVPPPAPPPGRVSVVVTPDGPAGFLDAVGFRPLGRLALRLDIVERLAETAWERAKAGPFEADAALMNLAGCGPEDLGDVLRGLGFEPVADGDPAASPRYRLAARTRQAARTAKTAPTPRRRSVDPNHPFAALRDLTVA